MLRWVEHAFFITFRSGAFDVAISKSEQDDWTIQYIVGIMPTMSSRECKRHRSWTDCFFYTVCSGHVCLNIQDQNSVYMFYTMPS